MHGFPENEEMMTILMDDDSHKHPTFLNITEAFKALSEQSQPGDAVFIHFSGHGGRVLDAVADTETESYDEIIVPSDYNTSGLVRDTLVFKTLLAPMRYGVTVTILIDACDTGMMLDLPYSWSTRSDRAGATAKMTQNDDFSFVRFLKVVKTLYESSTFTQLGKTVGSALTTGNQKSMDTLDDDITETDQSKNTRPEADELSRTGMAKMENPLLNIFGVCGSRKDVEPLEEKKSAEDATLDTRESKTKASIMAQVSILEQVLNCSLGHEVLDDGDDISEVESYAKSHATPSYSEQEYDDSTFDSYEEYSKSRRGRGRSRRRRG